MQIFMAFFFAFPSVVFCPLPSRHNLPPRLDNMLVVVMVVVEGNEIDEMRRIIPSSP